MAATKSISACKNKPPTCSSLLARSIRLNALLCRLCGCFFVRNIFSGVHQQARKVRWKSLYSIYSCACASLVAWIGFDTLASWTVEWSGHRESVDNSLHVVIHAMLLLRVTVNYLSMLSSSTKLVSIYQRASAYEKRTGVMPCECCITRQIFWSDARRCFVWALYTAATAITDPKGPGEVTDVLTQALYWMETFIWLVYDTMYTIALQSSGIAICEYLDHELRALTVFTRDHCIGFNRGAEVARRVEQVRLNVSTVLQLKKEINDMWAWSVVISSVFVLVVPCICVYEACHAAYDPEQRYFVVMYAVYTAYEFTNIVHVSQSLMNRAKKMKEACMALRSTDNTAVKYQIERLHESINPEEMALSGGDLFTLDMSLLVAMASCVISYAVILQQTTQSLKSRDATV